MVAARSSDAELRLPKVLSIGDAKSLYDHLRTETSGGANDRGTAMDIQIIRSSMDAQRATVKCVDHSGMYADAMTNRNGNIPLLQILMRTGRICITGEAAIMEKHRVQPSSRSRSSKTRIDPATRAMYSWPTTRMGVKAEAICCLSEARWCCLCGPGPFGEKCSAERRRHGGTGVL